MTTYVALLRAVNVGGTGKLPMAVLKAMCDAAGFAGAKTYIASGNVVFASRLAETTVKAELERRLAAYAGARVGVVVRSAVEMQAVLAANPFSFAAPNRTVAIFLDEAPAANSLHSARNCNGEELALGLREIYVHYGKGMAASRLQIPAAKHGTARNMNTVKKLAEMAASLKI